MTLRVELVKAEQLLQEAEYTSVDQANRLIVAEARIRELETEIRKLHGWRVEDSERIRKLTEVRTVHEQRIAEAKAILGGKVELTDSEKLVGPSLLIHRALVALEGNIEKGFTG